MMITRPRLAWLLAALLFLLPTSLIVLAVVFQAPITRLMIERAVAASDGRLELSQPEIDWRGQVRVAHVRWRSEGFDADAAAVTLAWRWHSLWTRRIELSKLHAESLKIATVPGDPDAPWPVLPYPGMDWSIDDMRMGVLSVARGDSAFEISQIRVALSGDRSDLHVQARSAQYQGMTLQAGALQAQWSTPHAFTLSAQLQTDVAPWLRDTAIQAGPDPLPVLLEVQGNARGASVRLQTRWHQASIEAEAQIVPERAALDGPVTVRLRDMDARRFVTQAPVTALSGSLQFDMAERSVRFDLDNANAGTLEQGLLPARRLLARVAWDDGRVILHEGQVADSGRGVLNGRASLAGFKTLPRTAEELLTRLEAELQFENLDLTRWTQSAWQSRLTGRVNWSGGRGQLDVRDRWRDQPLRVQTEIELSATAVRFAKLSAVVAGVDAQGQLELGLAKPHAFTWQGELGCEALGKCAPALSALQGHFRIQGTARGQLGDKPAVSVDLHLSEGRLGARSFTGSLRGGIDLATRQLRDLDLSLVLGRNRLRVQGDLGRKGDALQLYVRGDELSSIDPSLGGRFSLQARLEGESLAGPAPSPDALNVRVLEGLRVSLSAQGERLRLRALELESVSVRLVGDVVDHQLDMQLRIPAQTLHAQGKGRVELASGMPAAWAITLETLVADGVVKAGLERPAFLRLSREAQRMSDLDLAVAGGGAIRVTRLGVEGGLLDARGDIRDLPPARLIAWAEQGNRAASLPVQVESALDQLRLQADWTVQGPLPDGLSGTIDASVIDRGSDSASGGIGLDRNRLAIRLEQGRLSGTVELALSSLALARRYTGPDWQVAGRMAFAGEVGGTLKAPTLSGVLRGESLGLFNRALGWRLRDGQMLARLAPGQLQLESMRFLSGVDGELSLSGQLSHPPGSLEATTLRGLLEVRAKHLPVPLGPGQRLRVSGDTTLSVTGPVMRWAGSLRADDGLVELRSAGVPDLPADVRVLGGISGNKPAADVASPAANDNTAPMLQIETALQVDLGPSFKVQGGGVDARLEGAIALVGRLPQQLRANGVLRVREGVYTAWGRKLDIERGEIRFNGDPDNPTLDIVALRRGETASGRPVKAGVSLSGTALSPRIRLVSEPELTDAQKLAWLVLGSSLEDAAGAAQALALREAAMAILGSDDGGLLGALNQAFGLEFMGVGPAREGMRDALGTQRLGLPPLRGGARESTTSIAGQQVVTIGRRLSSRLMLSYEQGLNGLANLIRLQYDISRRLSLRAQGGRENAVDLLAWWSFD